MRQKPFILLSSLLGVTLLLPASVFAFNLVSPLNGQADVKTDAYFQWQEVSGATKYVLDVNKFTQSEDNILPGVCSAGICSFGFLTLKAGTIGYADEYKWRVAALNAAENPISSSPEWTFKTEQAPPGPPPPGGDGGDGDTPSTLGNPISAKNITELFNKIFNFLFGLAIFIVPVIVIYAAFLMLMGGGDPVKLQKGRMILLWTAIAFIIILLSRGLPVVFKNLL